MRYQLYIKILSLEGMVNQKFLHSHSKQLEEILQRMEKCVANHSIKPEKGMLLDWGVFSEHLNADDGLILDRNKKFRIVEIEYMFNSLKLWVEPAKL